MDPSGNNWQTNFFCAFCKGLLLWIGIQYTETERETKRDIKAWNETCNRCCIASRAADIQHGSKEHFFNNTNVFLIRPLTMGHVFFTLDAVPGNVIQQLVYDWLLVVGGAGVETAVWGRKLILERMTDAHMLA